jgi:hypothetical protein
MKKMKNLLILSTMLLAFGSANAQSLFNEESNVISYMDGKSFYNSDNGLTIEYGYISSYNTYGIKVKNKDGGKFYFINVEITTNGTFADLFGISADTGSNFGFRLYKGKLIIGRGEPGEQTFYLQ